MASTSSLCNIFSRCTLKQYTTPIPCQFRTYSTRLSTRNNLLNNYTYNVLHKHTPTQYNNTVLHTQQCNFSTIQLNALPSPPCHKQRHRVGRGPGSGMGKTAKRGHKGQGARSHVKTIFEGGQTPLWRRTPKRGFTPYRAHQQQYTELNIETLMKWIHCNRIDTTKPITLQTLQQNGLKIVNGVKLLGRGTSTVDRPIHIVVSDCTVAVKRKIEQLGGSVTLKYYTRVALRSLLHPEKYENRIRPSTESTPPPYLRHKYEQNLASGEIAEEYPLTVREQMILNGQTSKQKAKM